jgi:hypothetical protein
MTCMRCRGLMVSEYLFDLDGGTERWALSWRCVNCGHRDDTVMRAHRYRETIPSALVISRNEKVSTVPSHTPTSLAA